jgi:hypothetical protein
MKNYKIIVSFVCFAAVFGISNAANAKAAKCEITSYRSDKYVGPWDFSSRKGGSFEAHLPKQAGETVFTRYINITAPGRGVIGGA